MPKSSRKLRCHMKDDNLYKFTSFSDQINSISVSSIQRSVPAVAATSLEDTSVDSEESFLASGLQLQLVESQTALFKQTVRKLTPFIGSYGEVVFHQRAIFSKVESALAQCDDMSLVGLLRILTDLCKDIQSDFYEYFYNLLNVLGSRVKTSNSMKALFAIFGCIATCIKITLNRFKSEDVHKLMSHLVPFMETRKQLQVRFSSGAFAFVSKKLIESDDLVRLLYENVSLKTVEAFQLIVAEIAKGVGVDFSFRFPGLFKCILIYYPVSDEESVPCVRFLQSTAQLFMSMINKEHAKREDSVKFFWKTANEVFSCVGNFAPIFIALKEILNFQNGRFVAKYLLDEVLGLLVELKGKFSDNFVKWYDLCAIVLSYNCADKRLKNLHDFKNCCFSFDKESFTILSDLICTCLKMESCTLLKSSCLLPIIKLALEVFGNSSEKEERSRILAVNIVAHLVSQTSSSADQELSFEIFRFIEISLNANNLTKIEKCGIAFVSSRMTTNFAWAKKLLKLVESKLNINLVGIGTPEVTGRLEHFLWDKIRFTYALNHLKLTATQFSHLVSRIEKSPEDLDNLAALSIFLSSELGKNGKVVKKEELKHLVDILKPNFRSFDREVVKNTIEVFLSFNWPNENATNKTETNFTTKGLFRNMLEVASVEISVPSLREKLLYCDKLKHHIVSKTRIGNWESDFIDLDDLIEISFSYLVSLCFIRFVPLQKGIEEIIGSYRNHKRVRKVISDLLHETFDAPEARFSTGSLETKHLTPEEKSMADSLLKFYSPQKEFTSIRRRENLLDMFKMNISLAEISVDQLKNYFFKFLVRDFASTTLSRRMNIELILNTVSVNKEIVVLLSEDESHVPTLLAFFKVLSSLASMKTIKNDPKILQLAKEMLRSSLSFLQSAVLDFVFSFKLTYLEPYKDCMAQLCSDKSVKKGLNELKLSEENCLVHETHRDKFLEIMLPFLLGRLFNTGWISNVDERFRAIFQFVRYLSVEEKEAFITDAFADFSELLADGRKSDFEHSKFECNIMSRFLLVLQQVLRNMQRLSFLEIMKTFGKCNLNICLSLERSKKKWMKNSELASRNKRLSKQALVCLLSYVNLSSEPFEEFEVESICQVLLKPALVFNSSEDLSKASISIQAKFVESFAANGFYRKYLSFQMDSRNSKSLLECFCWFLQPNVSSQLQFFVLRVLTSLIPEEKEEISSECEGISDDGMDAQNEFDELGARLLKSHACFVIKFLQLKMMSDQFKKLNKNERVNLLKLLLFMVSDITSPEESLALATTLAAYMSKKRKVLPKFMSGDVTKLIVTLLRNCESPHSVLFTLASNFSENLSVEMRNDLTDIYLTISPEFVDLIKGLNSWNPKYVEEPDFARRFDCFSKIPEMLESMSPQNCVIAIAVVFKNCCFFIDTIDDFAIRDRCVETVKYMITKFDLNAKIVLMIKTHLSFMLKTKPEDPILINVLNMLKCFIENSHEKDTVLEELRLLQVGKIDYIDDISQLQVSRRCRGLLKIAELILQDKFCIATFQFFLIPIAWIAIVKFEQVKDPNLITASIEMLKSCATKMELNSLVRLAERCLLMVNQNHENPKVACRVLAATLTAFGSNDTLRHKIESAYQAEKAYVALNSFAGRILSMLMKQKLSDSDIIDKDESNAIIAKLPVHIGLYNVAKFLGAKTKDFHVKKLLLSMCGFLRSRDKSVRHATRGVLIQILPNLEVEYLNELIKDLFHLLDRGYLRHILVFTLYRILTESKACFTAGDISCENLKEIGKFLIRDLFGLGAEERTSTKLVSRTEEARKSYAIPCYGLMGYFCLNEDMVELLKPLSEGLEEKETSSNKRTISDILNRFGAELLLNKKLKNLKILQFVQEVCNGNLKKMFEKNSKDRTMQKQDPRLQPRDYRLLDPVPTRVVDRKANVVTFSYHHVFVQFGFQLLLKLTSKLDINTLRNAEMLSILQQLVPLVIESLNSSYLPVLIQSIRCMKEFLNLQSEGVLKSEIFDKLIMINKKFCRGTSISSDSQELVPVVANCIKIMLADEKLPVRNDQLTIILAHIEEDLADKNKVKSSLSLVKAIIARRLKHENVSEVVNKVSKLMIQSPIPSSRINCRNLYLDYLIGYAQEKAEKSLDFVLAQIVNYEDQTGRESALELLVLFVSKVSESFLQSVSDKLFFPLCLTLANDSAQSCRKLARLCLAKIFSRVGEKEYSEFTETVMKWMDKSVDLSLCMLGFLVMDILVENYRSSLDEKIVNFFKLSCKVLKDCNENQSRPILGIDSKATKNEERTRVIDYTVLSVLKLLHRVFNILDFSPDGQKKFTKVLPEVVEKVNEHLSYPHEWVQTVSCQIFASIFSKFNAEEFLESSFARIAFALQNPGRDKILTDFFKRTVDSLISNVSFIEAGKELMNISLKDVVYLTLIFAAEFLKDSTFGSALLSEIIDKMNLLALKESRFNQKSITKRQFVFDWNKLILQSKQLIQCCPKMPEETLHKLLFPVVRELISKSNNDSKPEFSEMFQSTYQCFEKAFKSLNKEGEKETFLSSHYTQIAATLRERKLERTVMKKREAVLNPSVHAAKKTEQYMKKRVNRKRKIAENRGKVSAKKGKLGSKAKNSEEILVEDLI